MKKEFKLSENRKKVFTANGEAYFVFDEKYVKEFIKICLADGWDKQYGTPDKNFRAGIQWMKERIIKNAGDDLK